MRVMLWAALVLAAGMAILAAAVLYLRPRLTRRLMLPRTEAQQRRRMRQAVAFSAGVGIAILAVGLVAFLITGYDWRILALTWAYGLFHLVLLFRITRRIKTRS